MERISMGAAMKRRTAGFSLLEIVIAIALLMIGILAMASVFAGAAQTAHSQGDLGETVALCESKMETLRNLRFDSGEPMDVSPYTDLTTDTTQLVSGAYPTTGGKGLTPGGSTTTAVSGYVDYLDPDGNQIASSSGGAPAGYEYTREWQITDTWTALSNGMSWPAANYKTISVRCFSTGVGDSKAMVPNVKITTILSQ
jgi:type II secretory pathway pseudopilin PulG